MFKAKSNFGEFLESEEKIATNILADRLQRLEDETIISKKADPLNKKKNIYQLTDKGIDLLPLVLEMVGWGAKYDSKTEAPKEFIENLKKDKAGMAREMMKGLRMKNMSK